jgi:hypothetical protein
MYKKISLLLLVTVLLMASTAIAPPCNSLLVYGKIYDAYGNAIGGVTVTARNVDTNEVITNGTYAVTATDGYQINLGNLNNCWQVGNTIMLYSEYTDGGVLYHNSAQILIPLDIMQQGSVIQRDLHLTQSNQSQNPPPPPPEGNRTHTTFWIYGVVKNSVGEAIDSANVTIRNENTGDELYNTTYNGGQYRIDIGTLTNGWRYNDQIKITARYGSGSRQETGSNAIQLRIGQTERQKDIQMLITEIEFPLSYEGLLDAYFVLFERYNLTSETMQILQDTVDYTNEQMRNMQQEHSQNETGYQKQINDLNDQIANIKDSQSNIPLYVAVAIGIILAIYILLDKVILPWRRGE